MHQQSNKKHRSWFLLLVLISLPGLRLAAQDATNNPDSIQVAATMTSFIEVFSNLQWDKFTSYFSNDVTAFFPPSAGFSLRAGNKPEVEKIFRAFFENVKKQKAAPPYLKIVPKDLLIQTFHSFAIVTFTLEDPDLLGRRTFVLKREGDRWLIIHLHASGVIITK